MERYLKINLDKLSESKELSEAAAMWKGVVEALFFPGDIPSPVLLRPIVDNVISENDIDIIYPETFFRDYLAHIDQVAERYQLHYIVRSYFDRTTSLRLFDKEGATWVAFDIHIKLHQMGDRSVFLRWENVAPRAELPDGLPEPNCMDAVLIYVLHLKAQNKDLYSESVQKRLAVFNQRFSLLETNDDPLVDMLLGILDDPGRLQRPEVFSLVVEEAHKRLCPESLSRMSYLKQSFVAAIHKTMSRKWFASKKLFFIGADGAGKSTLMETAFPGVRIIPNSQTYRGTLVYKVAKKIAKKKATGIQASDVFPRFFYLDSLVRTLFLALANRSKAMLFDRPPSDILVTSRKTVDIRSYPGSRWLARLSAGMLTVHVIGVGAEGFRNAKSEMSKEQIRIYNRLVFRLLTGVTPLAYIKFLNFPSVEGSVDTLKKVIRVSGVKMH